MEKSEYDIIIFALSRIDSEYSSTSICLSKEFAKTNRVFFINHPYSIKDWFSELFKNGRLKRLGLNFFLCRNTFEQTQTPSLVSVTPPLTLPINWLPPSKLFSILNQLNNCILQKSLKIILKKFQVSKFIFINSYDPFFLWSFPKINQQYIRIYQSVDDISQNSYTAKHGVMLEQKIAKNSELVITTSLALREKLERSNPNTHIVNNAVDFLHFNQVINKKLSRPKDIFGLKSPIIGYIGNLDDSRIDFELILEVAKNHQDKTILLVGPINSQSFYDLELDHVHNIVSVGSKNISQLPNYLAYMDLGLIPFKVNKLTQSIYPLKVNEYLAAGKGVISTNFSKDVTLFSDVIKISDSQKDFLDLVSDHFSEIKKDQKRITNRRLEVARSNTWEARVREIWKIIQSSH